MGVALTFELRCLGHSVKVSIEADDMLHLAPGWDVPLHQGTFGSFDEENKRTWAMSFIDDLLQDEYMQAMPALPLSVQKKLYLHVTLLITHLVETSLNHSRCHIAGMSLRLATFGPTSLDTSLSDPLSHLD